LPAERRKPPSRLPSSRVEPQHSRSEGAISGNIGSYSPTARAIAVEVLSELPTILALSVKPSPLRVIDGVCIDDAFWLALYTKYCGTKEHRITS
jgi:hypothetical protein